MLVGLYGPNTTRKQAEEYLDELEMLTDTAGGNTVEKVLQNRNNPDVSTYVGKGKLQELKGQMKALNIKTVIFDDDLSPTQIRNIEAGTESKVLDRSALILDIFASRAQTAAAKTQVESLSSNIYFPDLPDTGRTFRAKVVELEPKGPVKLKLRPIEELLANELQPLNRN